LRDDDKTREQLINELSKLRLENKYLKVIISNQLENDVEFRQEVDVSKVGNLDYFVDLSADILIMLDLNGNPNFINSNGLRELGYTKEELLNKSVMELIEMYCHPDDKKQTIDSINRALSDIPVLGFENRYRCKEGSYKWFSWTIIPFKEKELCYAIGREITEQKIMENELGRTNEILANIIESISDDFFVLDHKWCFMYINKHAEKELNKSRNELTGKCIWDIFPDFVGTNIYLDLLKGMSERKALHSEFRSIIHKNQWHEMDIYPCQYGLTVYIRDITERKKVETELEMSRQRFLKLFNMSPYIMCIKRLSDGKFIDVNETFERQTGYSRKEVLGYSPLELDSIVNRGDYQQMLRVLRNNNSIVNKEINYLIKSGEIRNTLVSAEIIELDNENVILASWSDITERKRVEQEIAKLDRMNLIGQMAAGLGHEIRNPMTTIRGTLQLLERKEIFSEYSRYFNTMIDEIDRANSIITEFLSLAKSKPSPVELKNLTNIVNSVFPLMLADAFNQDKDIIFEEGNIPDLQFNEKEIRQLILNLVRNGLESMPAGGFLTIKTYLENNEVILSIQDQGTGIDQELQNKLGTPFLTTKDNGIGLGLAVCYSIAKRHNAYIDINTSPKGTTFFVRFKVKCN